MSNLEEIFEFQLKCLKIDNYEREHKFDKVRRWRFDFAFLEKKIAVEIEGGLFINGRHNRGKGMIGDMEKYNSAVLQGWRVLRFDGKSVKNGQAISILEKLL